MSKIQFLLFILGPAFAFCSDPYPHLECGNGIPIASNLVLNGVQDCDNDENPNGVLKCANSDKKIVATLVCNGHNDCPDGSDEMGCEAPSDLPKCWVGAGNGVSDFFIVQPCTNLTAHRHHQNGRPAYKCYKRKLNGVVYKGCGPCVDQHYHCIECETESGGVAWDACNGGGMVPVKWDRFNI